MFSGRVVDGLEARLLLLRIAAMLHTWAILCPQQKRQEFSG
jgi:hypothetical protein